jgi:hypothetical protein
MNKAKHVVDVMNPLMEDKHDDHVALLKLHPNVPDAVKRKLDFLKKQKSDLEAKHDQVYQALSQNPDNNDLKTQLDAIDTKIDSLNQWISDQADHHTGAVK